MCDLYKEAGYESRNDYLHSLADENGIPYTHVALLAMSLGENEDFDGLVSIIEDYAELELI